MPEPKSIWITTLDQEDEGEEYHLAYTSLEGALEAVQGFAVDQQRPVRWLSETQWECIDTATSMWIEEVEIVR